MIIYILTAVDLCLTALFAILNKYVWKGFAYFVLSLLLVLSLVWCGWLIYKYFTSYKKETESQYLDFKRETIANNRIDEQSFTENEEYYKKQFKKSIVRQGIAKWLMILLCLSLAVMFLVGIILY
ncbi:MAG: hypothetical protein IJ817_01595 [Clostridia bacterium]|nr:hypothetical protein [Clostridia bacterium]